METVWFIQIIDMSSILGSLVRKKNDHFMWWFSTNCQWSLGMVTWRCVVEWLALDLAILSRSFADCSRRMEQRNESHPADSAHRIGNVSISTIRPDSSECFDSLPWAMRWINEVIRTIPFTHIKQEGEDKKKSQTKIEIPDGIQQQEGNWTRKKKERKF